MTAKSTSEFKVEGSIAQFTTLKEVVENMKHDLSVMGAASAEIGLTAKGEPVIRSFTINTPESAIAQIAQVDPRNIQQVYASQLDIINSYYKSVRDQSDRSFNWALVIAGIGVVFFIAAIAFFLTRQDSEVATISIIGGALAEFIAATLLYLYGQTSKQLTTFHIRLDRTNRFLLANSVCENLEGKAKQEALSKLVQQIGDAESLEEQQTNTSS